MDREEGWLDGLNIILTNFTDVAWQKGLYRERKRTAAIMAQLARSKGRGRSPEYQMTMDAIVLPFCERLKGENQPEPPFDIRGIGANKQARDDAIEIILDRFQFFARRKLQLERTLDEIADDMEKLVEYKDAGKSPAYQKAIADVVRPFYLDLKDKSQQKPLFNT